MWRRLRTKLLQPEAAPPARRKDHAQAVADVAPRASAGEPLEPRVREFLESRLHRDLGVTRVHADAAAATAANALEAQAYTVGRDIYFAPGMYSPTTDEGRRLLAHEVALR